MDNLGIPPSRQNWAKAIGLAVVNKAASGDKSAVEFVRDIAGDKNEPGEKTSAAQVIIITGEDKIAD